MKYAIVANHDLGEYSLHSIVNEAVARKTIETERNKGKNVTITVYNTPDSNSILQKAEENYGNYHYVDNALTEFESALSAKGC